MIVPIIRRRMIDDKEYHDCKKCTHGYFEDFDSTGWHNLCGAGYCYLCHQRNGGKCDEYKEGPIPKGKDPM